jgi:hypothetical protein
MTPATGAGVNQYIEKYCLKKENPKVRITDKSLIPGLCGVNC